MSPPSTAARKSRFVAATTLALTLMMRSAPTRRISRSCSARRSFACTVGATSPISSRNSVPFPATSNKPGLVSHGTRERAPHVPEEFGFQQCFGQGRAVDGHKRTAGARALIVDQAHDELFPGAALAVDQHRRVEWRHARRKLEHILHGCTACDEVFCGRVAGDALAQQIQLALTFGDVPLATIQFLQAPVHSFPEAFDLLSQIRALKVEAKRIQRVTPALCILSNDGARLRALRQTLGFAEVDLLPETGAHVPAGVALQ